VISSELWQRIKEGQFKVIPNGRDGWDVALVIDGTYIEPDEYVTKDEILAYWRDAELPILVDKVEPK
jgi:hypothetical protein